jgi:hypothetical protein
LANPDKFDGYVFGSSRVGSIHVEKIQDMKIYNMTYSCGTPHENYETLKTFIEGGVTPKIVYIGVDVGSYTEDYETHNNKPVRATYQYLQNPSKIFELYFRPAMVIQSLPTILKGNGIYEPDIFYNYGWTRDYDFESTTDWWLNAGSVLGNDYLLDETLEDLEDIKTLCEENGIKMVVFTNPVYKVTYLASLDVGYMEFLTRLADITDYYNFSGIDEVSTNYQYFTDDAHYNAYVGDIMIDAMINGKVDENLYSEGFGWYVTTKNVDDLKVLLNSQITMED